MYTLYLPGPFSCSRRVWASCTGLLLCVPLCTAPVCSPSSLFLFPLHFLSLQFNFDFCLWIPVFGIIKFQLSPSSSLWLGFPSDSWGLRFTFPPGLWSLTLTLILLARILAGFSLQLLRGLGRFSRNCSATQRPVWSTRPLCLADTLCVQGNVFFMFVITQLSAHVVVPRWSGVTRFLIQAEESKCVPGQFPEKPPWILSTFCLGPWDLKGLVAP